MPLYPYVCADCGAEIDLRLPVEERDAPPPCPALRAAPRGQLAQQCGGELVRRVLPSGHVVVPSRHRAV